MKNDNCRDFVSLILHEFIQQKNVVIGLTNVLIELYENNINDGRKTIIENLHNKFEEMELFEKEIRNWLDENQNQVS